MAKFCNEITHAISFVLSHTQDCPSTLLDAAESGWQPKSGGAEAKELFECMSWVGRMHAAKFVAKINGMQENWLFVHIVLKS